MQAALRLVSEHTSGMQETAPAALTWLKFTGFLLPKWTTAREDLLNSLS